MTAPLPGLSSSIVTDTGLVPTLVAEHDSVSLKSIASRQDLGTGDGEARQREQRSDAKCQPRRAVFFI